MGRGVGGWSARKGEMGGNVVEDGRGCEWVGGGEGKGEEGESVQDGERMVRVGGGRVEVG